MYCGKTTGEEEEEDENDDSPLIQEYREYVAEAVKPAMYTAAVNGKLEVCEELAKVFDDENDDAYASPLWGLDDWSQFIEAAGKNGHVHVSNGLKERKDRAIADGVYLVLE